MKNPVALPIQLSEGRVLVPHVFLCGIISKNTKIDVSLEDPAIENGYLSIVLNITKG